MCVCVCVTFGYLTAPLQLQMLHYVHRNGKIFMNGQ